MPPLHNPRREQFCQLLVQGLPASQAYVEVGYKPSRPAASRLQHDINISKRVRELMAEKARLHEESQRQAAQEAAIDKTWLIRQLKDAADIARRKDDPSGLVAAAREIGVLTGERIEKSEHGRPGEFAAIEAMSRAELEASIVKLVRQIEDDEPKLLAPPTDD